MKFQPKSILNIFTQRLRHLNPFQIFLLVSTVAALVYVVKFYAIKQVWKTYRIEVIGNYWASNYNPYGYRTPYWLSNNIKPGLIERDSGGKEIAKVLSVDNYERGPEEAEIFLTVSIKTFYNRNLNKFLFKGEPLDIGSAIELRPDNVLIRGQIVDDRASDQPPKEKDVVIVARWRYREPWAADQLKPGDTMKSRPSGEVIAEILDVKVEKSTAGIYQKNENDQLVVIDNPRLRDVVITFKAKVQEIDNRWYFSGQHNVKVGNHIYLFTSKVDVDNLEIQEVRDL